MLNLKKALVSVCGLLMSLPPVYAQGVITLDEAKELFKQRNVEYLVTTGKGTIEADAYWEEARKLENPELSLDQVNLWSTPKQRGGESVVIQPIVGGFAKNTEFAVGLSQHIRLGGKRRKKLRMAETNRNVVEHENRAIANDLWLDFVEGVFDLNYAEAYAQILNKQHLVLSTVVASYEKQKEQGYTATADLLRIKAEKLQLEKELNEVSQLINSGLKEIQTKLGDGNDSIRGITIRRPDMLMSHALHDLYDMASAHPAMLKGHAQLDWMDKKLDYERSLRIPDMTLSATYDRAGGVWNDFVGFGVSFTLPIFNRNQAQIKATRRLISLSAYEHEQTKVKLRNQIRAAYENYHRTLKFFNQLENEPTIAQLDVLLEKYQNNIIKKNISLIEFIDFMETYKSSKQILLATQKDLLIQKNIVENTIGTKLN